MGGCGFQVLSESGIHQPHGMSVVNGVVGRVQTDYSRRLARRVAVGGVEDPVSVDQFRDRRVVVSGPVYRACRSARVTL